MNTTVAVSPFFDVLQPYLTALVSGLASFALAYALAFLRSKWNITVDAESRDALQVALTNGAGALVHMVGSKVSAAKLNVHSPEVAVAVTDLIAAVPDAVNHFGITPELVAQKMLAKLPQLPEQAATIILKPSPPPLELHSGT